MAVIDLAARTAHVRIAYVGPAHGGKTTNLRWIADQHDAWTAGRLHHVDRADARTLFLDDLPVDLGESGGWRFLVDLLSVPGQPASLDARAAVLAGIDGVVFVADSDPARAQANRNSMEEVRRTLDVGDEDGRRVAMIVQANKRDHAWAVPVEDIARLAPEASVIPAVALLGEGVRETLAAICRATVRNL